MEFKYIVREETKVEKEKPQGVLIGNQRYRCMDTRYDGEVYHLAMASLDEKTFLYVIQRNNENEVVKSFSDSDSIAQFWRFKNFGKKDLSGIVH